VIEALQSPPASVDLDQLAQLPVDATTVVFYKKL
jgi:hypothetical protein